MKCYKCSKDFDSGQGYVEKVRSSGVAFDRYICQSCKEEVDGSKSSKNANRSHRIDNDADSNSSKTNKNSFFKIIGGLFIANLAAAILFVAAVLISGSFYYLFAVGYVLIVAWILFGFVGTVKKLTRWGLIFGSLAFHIYTIVFIEVYLFAPEVNMNLRQYLKYLLSTPLASFMWIFVEIPLYLLTDSFFLGTFFVFVAAMYWLSRNAVVEKVNRKFKPV
jgi:hypothetical protein